MPKASSALTGAEKGIPAVTAEGTLSEICMGEAGLTLTEPEVPAVKALAASLAVTV